MFFFRFLFLLFPRFYSSSSSSSFGVCCFSFSTIPETRTRSANPVTEMRQTSPRVAGGRPQNAPTEGKRKRNQQKQNGDSKREREREREREMMDDRASLTKRKKRNTENTRLPPTVTGFLFDLPYRVFSMAIAGLGRNRFSFEFGGLNNMAIPREKPLRWPCKVEGLQIWSRPFSFIFFSLFSLQPPSPVGRCEPNSGRFWVWVKKRI